MRSNDDSRKEEKPRAYKAVHVMPGRVAEGSSTDRSESYWV